MQVVSWRRMFGRLGTCPLAAMIPAPLWTLPLPLAVEASQRVRSWTPRCCLEVWPDGWPPEGAELLSRESARNLPPTRRMRLRLTTLQCPQPKDPLRWRILPLVRTALATADEDLGLNEISRFVEANLPPVCHQGISSARLWSLVSLVVSRNVRCRRLLVRGKKYHLPISEDPTLLVPQLSSTKLDALCIAWCPDTKVPREAALRYDSLWLIARFPPATSSECSESVDVAGTAVRLGGGEGVEAEAHWKDDTLGLSWTLRAHGRSLDLVLDMARQVIEQSRVSAEAS